MSKIYFLPVKHGDAFIIECVRGDTQGLVVVDGGPRSCGFELKRKLNELGTPDLMVLTHYDEDHIGGILQLVDTCLDDNMIPAKEVWANCAGYVEVAASKYTTAAHGMLLSVRLNELAKQHGMVWRNDLHEGMEFDRPFASIEVVSPTEDVTKMVIEKQKENKHKNIGDKFILFNLLFKMSNSEKPMAAIKNPFRVCKRVSQKGIIP